MGFLDSLESNLDTLENSQERDPAELQRVQSRRESDKKQALAAAPFADALKKSQFTMDLITHATRIGHGRRTKVHMTWFGTTLRLQAKERRLELRPTPEGVLAVFSREDAEEHSELIDLNSNPETLAQRWLEAD